MKIATWKVVVSIVLAIVAVMGHHFTEVAKTKFWWVFWEVSAYASLVILIAGWVYLFMNQQDDRKHL